MLNAQRKIKLSRSAQKSFGFATVQGDKLGQHRAPSWCGKGLLAVICGGTLPSKLGAPQGAASLGSLSPRKSCPPSPVPRWDN